MCVEYADKVRSFVLYTLQIAWEWGCHWWVIFSHPSTHTRVQWFSYQVTAMVAVSNKYTICHLATECRLTVNIGFYLINVWHENCLSSLSLFRMQGLQAVTLQRKNHWTLLNPADGRLLLTIHLIAVHPNLRSIAIFRYRKAAWMVVCFRWQTRTQTHKQPPTNPANQPADGYIIPTELKACDSWGDKSYSLYKC